MRKYMEWIFITVGLLCLCYSVMIARVGSGTGFFIVWAAIGAVLIGAFALLHTGLWGRIPAAAASAIKALCIAGLLIFIAVECIIFSGFAYKAKGGLDYIIVLGAHVRDSGPSAVLKYRIDKAYEYLMDNGSTACIVSGGRGANEPCTEAVAMKKYLGDMGIEPSRIIMEDRSRSTAENLRLSKAIIGDAGASVGIVTNNFHIYRAVAAARRQGLEEVCWIVAGSNPLYLPNNMLREFFGVAKDKLMGNI